MRMVARLATTQPCGVLMHSSLVVTSEGLPLGLAAIKFWTRSKFHGSERAQAQHQPDPRAHRTEGKLSLD